jgi:hypothetical protein
VLEVKKQALWLPCQGTNSSTVPIVAPQQGYTDLR